MSLNDTKKCILPWIHLNIESDGNVYPCCQSDAIVGNLGNIKNENIEEIWKGKKFIQLRNEMMSDIEPNFCKSCYDSERLGSRSKRMRENDLWEKYHYLTDTVEVEASIPYIDIRFSNICNLKCRTCGPWASHSWAYEYKQLGWELKQKEIIASSTDDLKKFLKKNILNLEQIYFCGGEPIYTVEHYELLDMLIESNNLEVEIRYSTNLSDLKFKNYNVLDYWKCFKNISVHASLDDIEDRLEYIRYGSDWNKILNNLNDLKKINIDIKISPTVGILNILTLDKTFETYVNYGFITADDFNVNVLETPTYYSVQALRPELKLVAKDRIEKLLNTYDMSTATQSKFKYLLRYMFEKDLWEENKEKFKSITEQLDKVRNQNFTEIFPELEMHIL